MNRNTVKMYKNEVTLFDRTEEPKAIKLDCTKARITFLRNRIETDTKELNELLTKQP